jgi:hypothetical protein
MTAESVVAITPRAQLERLVNPGVDFIAISAATAAESITRQAQQNVDTDYTGASLHSQTGLKTTKIDDQRKNSNKYIGPSSAAESKNQAVRLIAI